jgi:hypothetical protein
MLRSAFTPIRRLAALSIAAACLAAIPVAAATPSTSKGQISVAQVMDILDRAPSDGHAAQLLTAYLGGLGETAGIMVSATNASGQPYVTCERSLALDDKLVRSMLKKAAPDKASWGETAATPLIVSALVSRAGCR